MQLYQTRPAAAALTAQGVSGWGRLRGHTEVICSLISKVIRLHRKKLFSMHSNKGWLYLPRTCIFFLSIVSTTSLLLIVFTTILKLSLHLSVYNTCEQKRKYNKPSPLHMWHFIEEELFISHPKNASVFLFCAFYQLCVGPPSGQSCHSSAYLFHFARLIRTTPRCNYMSATTLRCLLLYSEISWRNKVGT